MFFSRLRQHKYFKTEGKIEDIVSPTSKKFPNEAKSRIVGLSTSLTNLFGIAKAKKDNDGSSSRKSDTRTSPVGTKEIPKMNILFGKSSNVVTGYYCSVEFLDK